MDVFDALENRIARLIEAYTGLESRVRELEQENRELRDGGRDAASLRERVDELEAERGELRQRLERILGKLEALDV